DGVVMSLYPALAVYNRPARTPRYPLSLHDALPIFAGLEVRVLDQRDRHRDVLRQHLALQRGDRRLGGDGDQARRLPGRGAHQALDRKSTRLNSSHVKISYAVFCLKKKKITPFGQTT